MLCVNSLLIHRFGLSYKSRPYGSSGEKAGGSFGFGFDVAPVSVEVAGVDDVSACGKVLSP